MRFRDPELRFTLLLALALAVLAIVPELVGLAVHLPHGVLPFPASDIGVYYSYIEQVRQGGFLLRDLMTGESQPTEFVNGYWMLAGLLARVSGLGPHIVFFILRVLFVPVAALAALYAARTFLEKPDERRLALLLILFGSGWGAWALVFGGLIGLPLGGAAMPIDVWVPETSLLGMAVHSGHYLASFAALVTAIAAAYRFALKNEPRPFLLAAVLLFALGLFHPYYVPLVLLVVLFGWLALKPTGRSFWMLLGAGFLLALCGVLGLLPYALSSLGDTTTILRNALNATPMPELVPALLGAGAFLPFALIALWRGKLNRTPQWRFLAAWFVVQAMTLYAPIPWQRKMTEAFIVPLALLAASVALAQGRRLIAPVVAQARRIAAAALFFAVFSASTLLVFVSMLAFHIDTSRLWLLSDDRSAILWMRQELPTDALIVATHPRANAIAAFAGRRVYAAHWAETIALPSKLAALQWLGSGARDDAARLRFLRRVGITHVYVGPLERSSWTWDPAGTAGMREVFRNGTVAVYAVDPPDDTVSES